MKRFALAFAVLLAASLGACSRDPVRIENTKPAEPPPKPTPAPAAKLRKEPIFYNGKTYQLSFGEGKGNTVMRVAGMTAKQQKDAEAVATSSLRYFKCKDGQGSKLTSGPRYIESVWEMTARCV
jgi:hypothetical protein